MKELGKRGWATIVLVVACAACTLIVDRSTVQCTSDTDCEPFGSHPFCSNGVCVPSGLGPLACFFGTPEEPQDFLNQCGSAECQAFDDCQRLGLCDGGVTADVALIAPPAMASAPADAAAPMDVAAPATDTVVLPSCADATERPHVLYMTGSSYFPALMAKLAPLIFIATGYTPVYKVSNSCTGVKSVLGPQPGDHVMSDPPPGSTSPSAMYFTAAGASAPCSLGGNGAVVDVGESDIFSTTCAGFGAPDNGIFEYLGPVQSMVFVVPGSSNQMTISAAAAREVFGMGGDHDAAAPWTEPSLYFVRNANAGTQQIIAHAIGVPASAFWGVDQGSPTNIDLRMRVIEDPVKANQAIGIMASDTFDTDRSNLRALGFKASGQDCAYLPDSTASRTDKANVRDGHYPIWGPLHFFTNVSGGDPVSPAAQAFIQTVVVPKPPQQLVDAFITSHLVPDCAMEVKRTTELGPLSAYSPPFQCTCYFEKSAGGSAPGCTTCTTPSDCNDPRRPSCNFGFCEVR
jgi:hypothetical protein